MLSMLLNFKLRHYRKNDNFEQPAPGIKAPLSALARSANIFNRYIRIPIPFDIASL